MNWLLDTLGDDFEWWWPDNQSSFLQDIYCLATGLPYDGQPDKKEGVIVKPVRLATPLPLWRERPLPTTMAQTAKDLAAEESLSVATTTTKEAKAKKKCQKNSRGCQDVV